MYRGTTPTVILHVKNDDFDLSSIRLCHITIKSECGTNQITYSDPQILIEDKEIRFEMSQEETYSFEEGYIGIQVRAKLRNGRVIPSKVIRTTMNEALEGLIL